MGVVSEFRVLNTTPDHPASKDLATISAELETGDEDKRKGFLNLMPQKSMDRSISFLFMGPPLLLQINV